jgi:dihydroxyacetone kinase-like protein
MKKIINNPNDVVKDMLRGMELSYNELKYTPELEVISKKEKTTKVGLVSGGGSGHEPAHAGYVGDGMLDAAVCGNVFASPSPDRILEGIKEADTGKGVLLIVKNYSGDIMNFEMAMDLSDIDEDMIDMVIVHDDVAMEDSDYSTGRRGIAGTVFVHKIAGAMSQRGEKLSEVKRVAQKTIDNVRSMGMSMSSCTIPAVGKAGFEIKEDEIEIGMGIHGEAGIYKKPVMNAKELADELVGKITDDFDFLNSEVALMINGLGATPLMELYIMSKEVIELLQEKNIITHKVFVGNYMTALEMAGCSVSLLKLDDELKSLLNDKCNTPAMKN